MLEAAVAVAETAFLICEDLYLAGDGVEAFHIVDHVGRLGAVGTDILNRGCSDFTGYAGQILKPGKSFGEAPVYEVCPLLSGTCDYKGRVGIFIISRYPFHGRVEHKSVEILDEKEVASATDVEHFVVGEFGRSRYP